MEKIPLVLIAPVIAHNASGGDGIEMLQAALGQTDQLIERSQSIVEASGSAQAQQALDLAIELQNKAKDQFQLQTMAGYAAAKILTMSARDKVRLALRLISAGQGANELQDGAVQRRLDQAGDKLDP